jgi:hypothetical protein
MARRPWQRAARSTPVVHRMRTKGAPPPRQIRRDSIGRPLRSTHRLKRMPACPWSRGHRPTCRALNRSLRAVPRRSTRPIRRRSTRPGRRPIRRRSTRPGRRPIRHRSPRPPVPHRSISPGRRRNTKPGQVPSLSPTLSRSVPNGLSRSTSRGPRRRPRAAQGSRRSGRSTGVSATGRGSPFRALSANQSTESVPPGCHPRDVSLCGFIGACQCVLPFMLP